MKIEGIKIRLRDLQLDDLASWEKWQGPDQAWQKTDGPYYPPQSPENIKATAANLQQRVLLADWPTPRRRLIIAQRQSDGLLGVVNRYWQSRETNWLSIGIAIYDPAYWRKGIGFEALGLWMDHLFQAMPQLVRLDMRTWSGNSGMMRLAEKLGCTLEARFRKARIVDGAYFDGLGYGILKAEWVRSYPDGFSKFLQGNQ